MEFELSQIEGMIHQDLLPNCPPTKFDPTNLEEARRHPDTVQRYYASELMEMNSTENPPFELLLKKNDEEDKSIEELINQFNQEEKYQLAKMASVMTRLISGDDVCDKVGVMYLAKILAFSQQPYASRLITDVVSSTYEYNRYHHKKILSVAENLMDSFVMTPNSDL